MKANTQIYLNALILNDGQQDEITLGENLGLTEEVINKIISELLAAKIIESQSFGICSYRPIA